MYLVSSCLAGVNCRYDGRNTENKFVVELMKEGKAIPVCPEQLGGLPVPRACCEIVMTKDGSKKVISKDGKNLTKEFIDGGERALAIAKIMGIKKAILKSKSPSCGCGLIYDGRFSGDLVEGNGITAELFTKNGIEVYTENDLDRL